MSDINWNELNASDIYCLLINAPDHYDEDEAVPMRNVIDLVKGWV